MASAAAVTLVGQQNRFRTAPGGRFNGDACERPACCQCVSAVL
jgi:hypothetical protein